MKPENTAPLAQSLTSKQLWILSFPVTWHPPCL